MKTNVLHIQSLQHCFHRRTKIGFILPQKNKTVSKNKNRQNKYKPSLHKLNFDNIEFPKSFTDVPKFEKQNNIGINVFGFEKNKILPLYLSKIKKNKNYSFVAADR